MTTTFSLRLCFFVCLFCFFFSVCVCVCVLHRQICRPGGRGRIYAFFSSWSLLLFIWWLLREPFGLLDVEHGYRLLHFFLVTLAFLAAAGFLTSFFVLGFFAATFGFVSDFVPDGFLTAGFFDVPFLEDGLFVEDIFLEEVSFLVATGFFVETFVAAAGFSGLDTGFLLGAAGFFTGFFCSFGSLNDPEAPTPFV